MTRDVSALCWLAAAALAALAVDGFSVRAASDNAIQHLKDRLKHISELDDPDTTYNQVEQHLNKEYPAYSSEAQQLPYLRTLEEGLSPHHHEAEAASALVGGRSVRGDGYDWVRKALGGMEPRRTRERSGWGGGYGK